MGPTTPAPVAHAPVAHAPVAHAPVDIRQATIYTPRCSYPPRDPVLSRLDRWLRAPGGFRV